MKYASFSKSYYFMLPLAEGFTGWALLVYSKRVTKWVFAFDENRKPGDEQR